MMIPIDIRNDLFHAAVGAAIAAVWKLGNPMIWTKQSRAATVWTKQSRAAP